jgi:chromosome partitioning protein
MTKSIVVASQKGGVGKTTVSLNLAVALAEQGRKTVLVDLDPQGAIGHSLAKDETEWGGVAEILTKALSPEEARVRTKLPSLDIIPRGRLDPCEVVEFEAAMRESGTVKALLDEVSQHAEFVVVDTPSGLGSITRSALSRAHYVLVPFQAEMLTLRTVGQLLQVVYRIRETENPGLHLLGILPTMVELGKDESVAVMSTLWSGFGGLLDTMIPRSAAFATASRLGVPVGFLAGPTSIESRRFDNLAAEVNLRIAELENQGDEHDRPQRELV